MSETHDCNSLGGERLQLSLSRLSHRLPGCEAHPEVVEGTTDFHHDIADVLLPQAAPVFDDTTALHAPVDMLNPQPMVVQALVGGCLLHRQFLVTGLLGGHEHRDLEQRAGQEASILQESTPRGQRGRGGLGKSLVTEAAATGLAEEEHHEQRMHVY